MEQENLESKVDVVEVVKTDLNVINISEALKEIEKEKEEYTYDDIFVTEKDTFDVEIKYYKIAKELMVESVDESFDKTREDMHSFKVKLKYPSQRDQEIIMSSSFAKTLTNMNVMEFIQLELVRINTLIRSWTIKKELSAIVEMDPKIIKAICIKVRDELGMRGIV